MGNPAQSYSITYVRYTWHPTQLNVAHLNRSQADRYSICLPRTGWRLSWPRCWLYTEMVYLSTDSHPS